MGCNCGNKSKVKKTPVKAVNRNIRATKVTQSMTKAKTIRRTLKLK